MNDMMQANMMGRVLTQSFKSWASKDPKYKHLYKKLQDPAFSVITDAMTELQDHKPGTYEFWWANEHMRYKGKIPGEQMRLVHELMYQFLTKYARGVLTVDTASASGKNTAKKANRKTANKS